ncbi:MAG: spore coat protein [Treponema sp.]|nr:spore coat protein [Treponema sp.]
MTAIILQARIDSTRLPGKALLLLDGKPLLLRVMEALNHVPADLRILACPDDSQSSFAPLAKEAGYKLFTGPKEDVLERYCQAIRRFSIKRIIRATGDNPFVFADAATAINAEAIALKADYSSYSGMPVGAGVESILASALGHIKTPTAFDQEHVCPYLYTHPDFFHLHRPLAPVRWQGPNIRLTVDTQEDFNRAEKLYAVLENEPLRYHGPAIIAAYISLFGSIPDPFSKKHKAAR